MFQFRDQIVTNINSMAQSHLCSKDIELLKAWKWDHNITADRNFDLTVQVRIFSFMTKLSNAVEYANVMIFAFIDHIDSIFDLKQGEREMQAIARNYQRRFPHILHTKYDKKSFHFRHTEHIRTYDSFRAFADELFGENGHQQIDAEPPFNKPDLLLKVVCHIHHKSQFD